MVTAGSLHFLASAANRLLIDLLPGSVWTAKALDSGIIQAFFKGHPSLFQRDHIPTVKDDQKLSFAGTTVMDHVSRFLLHSPVLHAFLRVVHRIEASETLEKEMKGKSNLIWKSWERCKKKAIVIQDFRRELKAKPFIFCTYQQCPLREVPPTTSLEWRDNHREFCRMKDIVSMKITDYDLKFFTEWIFGFLSTHSGTVKEMVNNAILNMFNRPDNELSTNERLMKTGSRNPIFYLNFDTPSPLMPENCFQVIIDMNAWLKRVPFLLKPSATTVVIEWQALPAHGLATVFAIFPGQDRIPYFVKETVELVRKHVPVSGAGTAERCIAM
ncbi:hypothetical protein E1B28_005314 [Marasmius oreades]|uniref:Uncharacterized protein n=1 Tax=Marasmius oreades TaxID=181124 RepID=A0A9P8ADP9_9AGAR|nr:uncharacterized protein E1B28_005314 [Marasmius oreades]KAG7098006.1 hypothetical protein E1B28_005314 [Marasmius oreades]